MLLVRRTWHKVTGLQAMSGQMRYNWIFERYEGECTLKWPISRPYPLKYAVCLRQGVPHLFRVKALKIQGLLATDTLLAWQPFPCRVVL
jgi:hypothetical protein